MSGFYGSMLLGWSELRQPMEHFDMDPKINDGYDEANFLGIIYGIIQNDSSGVKVQNGNLVRYVEDFLYYDEELKSGTFIKVKGYIYRLVLDNEWPSQGGFYRYILNKLVGSNGSDVEETNDFAIRGDLL